MNKGRKQYLRKAAEYDLLYNKHIYCYLRNHGNAVRNIKRAMNRRWRVEGKRDLEKELEEL